MPEHRHVSLDVLHGRGVAHNPANRFAALALEPDLADVEHDEEYLDALARPPTQYLVDASRTIIARNDSPDIGFDQSINVYRGCSHGCAYCFARPTHEYLGFSAGLDFETKVMVKRNAPELLRAELMAPRYVPARLAMSGVTDCYQPAERRFTLTRQCLQVLAEFRHPASVITKNHLIVRDADVLAEMAAYGGVVAMLSVTTLDADLTRTLEPAGERAEAAARRDPRVDGRGRAVRRDRRADHPGPERPRGPGDPRRGRRGRRELRDVRAAATAVGGRADLRTDGCARTGPTAPTRCSTACATCAAAS